MQYPMSSRSNILLDMLKVLFPHWNSTSSIFTLQHVFWYNVRLIIQSMLVKWRLQQLTTLRHILSSVYVIVDWNLTLLVPLMRRLLWRCCTFSWLQHNVYTLKGYKLGNSKSTPLKLGELTRCMHGHSWSYITYVRSYVQISSLLDHGNCSWKRRPRHNFVLNNAFKLLE